MFEHFNWYFHSTVWEMLLNVVRGVSCGPQERAPTVICDRVLRNPAIAMKTISTCLCAAEAGSSVCPFTKFSVLLLAALLGSQPS